MNDSRAVPAVIAALKDANSTVRVLASRYLAKNLDERAFDPLIDRLTHDEHVGVRSYAAVALGRSGDPGSIEALVAALKDDYEAVRSLAAASLNSLNWKPAGRVEQIRYEIARGELQKAANLAPKVELNADATQAEGALAYDTPLLVRLRQTTRTDGVLGHVEWIEFTRLKGRVHARLAVRYPSGPKARWRALVQLFDDAGKVLGAEGALIENSGVPAAVAARLMDRELEFGTTFTQTRTHKLDFGAERDMPGLARFRITLAEAKDDDMAEHARFDPPAVFQGTVTDTGGKPLAGVKVHASTGMATWFPLHPVSEFATDTQGRFRIEVSAAAAVYNDAARRWDPAIGIRLEHPGYQTVGDDFWTGRIRGIPGRVTTQDFQMQPTVATQPAS